MSEPHTTKASDWFDAYQRGERLPEHELPEPDPTDDEIWTMHQEQQP